MFCKRTWYSIPFYLASDVNKVTRDAVIRLVDFWNFVMSLRGWNRGYTILDGAGGRVTASQLQRFWSGLDLQGPLGYFYKHIIQVTTWVSSGALVSSRITKICWLLNEIDQCKLPENVDEGQYLMGIDEECGQKKRNWICISMCLVVMDLLCQRACFLCCITLIYMFLSSPIAVKRTYAAERRKMFNNVTWRQNDLSPRTDNRISVVMSILKAGMYHLWMCLNADHHSLAAEMACTNIWGRRQLH